MVLKASHLTPSILALPLSSLLFPLFFSMFFFSVVFCLSLLIYFYFSALLLGGGACPCGRPFIRPFCDTKPEQSTRSRLALTPINVRTGGARAVFLERRPDLRAEAQRVRDARDGILISLGPKQTGYSADHGRAAQTLQATIVAPCLPNVFCTSSTTQA